MFEYFQVAGQGPTIGVLNERRQEREIAAAYQTGPDVLKFGVKAIDEESGSKPKKRSSKRDMFKARLLQSGKGLKVISCDLKSTSKTRKTYHVLNSERGIVKYEVVITNTPSCNCKDFRIYKEQVLCKHIIFVVVHALQANHLHDALRSRYLGDEDLKTLLANQIPEEFLMKKTKRSW